MEEKIEIWQVGNTGLRNPNRIQEGFKAFANSPYVGNLRKENEIDFIAEKPEEKIYIQVTESMQSPETRQRELRPLQMMSDNYEKIILSMDRSFITSYDGIKSINLIDWLLS